MLGGIGMNNKAEYTPEKVVDISNLSREDWLRNISRRFMG